MGNSLVRKLGSFIKIAEFSGVPNIQPSLIVVLLKCVMFHDEQENKTRFVETEITTVHANFNRVIFIIHTLFSHSV